MMTPYLFEEGGRASLHGVHELQLIYEGDENHSLPLVLLPVQVCLEVLRVEALDG